MMLILKLPLVYLCWVVWWAIKAEPLPPEHPLWRTPGVLISPHVGGPSTAFFPRADRLIAAQLGRFAAGTELENIIT